MSYAAPATAGQAAVIRAALRDAGIEPREVSYVEAHGTATPLGDPIEVAALARTIGGQPGDPVCHLGSVKGNIGHLDVAAGMAGLVKTVLALEHEVIPATLHVTQPNPRLELERTRLRLASEPVAWPRGGVRRIAGVSSFGLGGTNGHVIVTEAPAPAPRPVVEHPGGIPLVLSADTPEALGVLADRLAPALGTDLPAAARTLAARRARSYRRVVLAGDAAQAAAELRPGAGDDGRFCGDGRVAFVFSGAGRHVVAEAARLAGQSRFAEPYDQARAAFEALGVSVAGPDVDPDTLRRITVALPALFAAQVALARFWQSVGVVPAAVAGHSVGEYAAAHIAGVMSLDEAAALVWCRAQLLDSASPGQMAVVALPAAEAGALAERFGLEVAAINTADSCVLSGSDADIARLRAHAEQTQLSLQPIAVDTAAHSAKLAGPAQELARMAAGMRLQPAQLPFVSAVTGTQLAPADLARPQYWADHLCRPVRFADVVTVLAEMADVFVEIGPAGTVEPLLRANRRIDPGCVIGSLPHSRENADPVARLTSALGRAWVAGATVDWTGLLGAGARVALPSAPFVGVEHTVRPSPVPSLSQSPAGAPDPAVSGPALFVDGWQRVAPGPPTPPGDWVVLGPASELRDGLVAAIGKAGGTARLVDEVPAELDVDGVLDLTGTARPATPFAHHLELVAAVGERAGRPVRLVSVTAGALSLPGDGFADPAAALAIGPVTVAGREYPRLTTCVIDIACDAAVDAVAAMLVAAIAEPETVEIQAIRGRGRWRRTWTRVPEPSCPDVEHPDDLGPVLITGGFGGIGRSLALHLARSGTTRLALVGRNPPEPDRHAADPALAAVRAMQAAGAQVLTIAADCCDESAMRAALAQIVARFGAVRSVVHAAGVPGGGLIRLRAAAECAAVLAPKVSGSRVLATVLADQPIERVVLCSALDAVLGTVGQVDHVAANAFLDALPATDWFGTASVTSVLWGAWREVGQAADTGRMGALAAWRSRVMADAIRPDDGARIAAGLLRADLGGSVVVAVNHPDDLLTAARDTDIIDLVETAAPPVTTQNRPRLAVPYREPVGLLPATVARIWSTVIGVEPIGMDDNYFALGGNSLGAMALVARLRKLFTFPIGLTDVLVRPTVAEQADWLSSELDSYLSQLSDEEVDRQLDMIVAADEEGQPS